MSGRRAHAVRLFCTCCNHASPGLAGVHSKRHARAFRPKRMTASGNGRACSVTPPARLAAPHAMRRAALLAALAALCLAHVASAARILHQASADAGARCACMRAGRQPCTHRASTAYCSAQPRALTLAPLAALRASRLATGAPLHRRVIDRMLQATVIVVNQQPAIIPIVRQALTRQRGRASHPAGLLCFALSVTLTPSGVRASGKHHPWLFT